MEEIARRAGVGMGTLYRRFPTKAALVDAIFEEHLDRLGRWPSRRSAGRRPLARPRRVPRRTVALQAGNRGFAEIMAVHLRDRRCSPSARPREAARGRAPRAGAGGGRAACRTSFRGHLGAVLDECARRGRDPRCGAGVLAAASRTRARRSAAEGATPLPHPPLTPDQYQQAMRGLAWQLRCRPPRRARLEQHAEHAERPDGDPGGEHCDRRGAGRADATRGRSHASGRGRRWNAGASESAPAAPKARPTTVSTACSVIPAATAASSGTPWACSANATAALVSPTLPGVIGSSFASSIAGTITSAAASGCVTPSAAATQAEARIVAAVHAATQPTISTAASGSATRPRTTSSTCRALPDSRRRAR